MWGGGASEREREFVDVVGRGRVTMLELVIEKRGKWVFLGKITDGFLQTFGLITNQYTF